METWPRGMPACSSDAPSSAPRPPGRRNSALVTLSACTPALRQSPLTSLRTLCSWFLSSRAVKRRELKMPRNTSPNVKLPVPLSAQNSNQAAGSVRKSGRKAVLRRSALCNSWRCARIHAKSPVWGAKKSSSVIVPSELRSQHRFQGPSSSSMARSKRSSLTGRHAATAWHSSAGSRRPGSQPACLNQARGSISKGGRATQSEMEALHIGHSLVGKQVTAQAPQT
mmetsp:Transcript_19834/g.37317  ORF Transcript_19834/g.37317 Transcript_19834/m.37317 type:complete len:225 (-) Transcript_19834:40-714(-)